MSLETIGNGIKTRLQTISGLKVFAPNELPDSINQFPCALILPGETHYHAMMSGDADYIFRVLVLFTKQDAPSALGKMLDYIELTGTYSVKAAIEGDRTLNSSADDVRVDRNLGIGFTSWGGYNYLSTEFQITIWK